MTTDATAASPGASTVLSGLKPVGGMVVVQSIMAGLNIFYKLAVSDGMAPSILVAYRCLFAAAVLCPVAYILKRKKRPPMTGKVLLHGFLSGLFGATLMQHLYVVGIKFTSVTFATAIGNLVPVMTFVLAVSFRIEKVGFGTAAGNLKVGGTAVGVGGAMLLTFYKGCELHLWSSPVNLLDRYPAGRTPAQGSLFFGALMCLGSEMSYSLWLILQAKMGHHYPCPYSSTALMAAMASAQAVVFALVAVRGNWKAWKLGFNIRLLTVMYNGIIVSAIAITLQAWVVNKKGPLYVSVFNPLILVSVAIIGSLLLGEKLYIGSILGSVLIVCGLYLILWAKRQEVGEANVADQERLPTMMTPKGIGRGSSRHNLVVVDSTIDQQCATILDAGTNCHDCSDGK